MVSAPPPVPEPQVSEAISPFFLIIKDMGAPFFIRNAWRLHDYVSLFRDPAGVDYGAEAATRRFWAALHLKAVRRSEPAR